LDAFSIDRDLVQVDALQLVVELLTLRLVRLLILLLDRDRRRAHSSVIVSPAAAAWLVLRIIHGMR
jgi:hypothetical protein